MTHTKSAWQQVFCIHFKFNIKMSLPGPKNTSQQTSRRRFSKHFNAHNRFSRVWMWRLGVRLTLFGLSRCPLFAYEKTTSNTKIINSDPEAQKSGPSTINVYFLVRFVPGHKSRLRRTLFIIVSFYAALYSIYIYIV